MCTYMFVHTIVLLYMYMYMYIHVGISLLMWFRLKPHLFD